MVDFSERRDDSAHWEDAADEYRPQECRVQSIGALLPQVLARYTPTTIALPLSAGLALQSVANPAMTA